MAVTANYTSPDLNKQFQADKSKYKNTDTDRNAPVEPSNSKLGDLRREIMHMQDEINTFLTERMDQEKSSKQDTEELEKKILDREEDVEEI